MGSIGIFTPSDLILGELYFTTISVLSTRASSWVNTLLCGRFRVVWLQSYVANKLLFGRIPQSLCLFQQKYIRYISYSSIQQKATHFVNFLMFLCWPLRKLAYQDISLSLFWYKSTYPFGKRSNLVLNINKFVDNGHKWLRYRYSNGALK